MKVPISWLEDYIKVKYKLEDLMWRMTEVGMTTETYEKIGKEIVLDVEVTPNRPDWLSITGIAREIGALQDRKIDYPKLSSIAKKTADLPIDINIDHKLCSRYTAITIKDIHVRQSPNWMQEYLKLVGLRPINNLVDITNFVMFELGVPIHVFDYDKIKSKKLKMQLSHGGEEFVSVDGKAYELPENAIIIKDKDRLIDLCGIKGGDNTAIDENTKNIYIHVPVYTPEIIRKTSQKLKLASDASYIYERGANSGGTLDTLKRVVDLVIQHAGGEVASDVIDKKQKDFVPSGLILNLDKLNKVLGVEVQDRKVVTLLKNLDFQPTLKGKSIVCSVPTFRPDVNIEEDLIEEVARMYGYNEFPKTLPLTQFNSAKVPFSYDFDYEKKLKQIMTAAGYHEVSTLSLISKETIEASLLPPDSHIKISNPVSSEYEYMRLSLIPNLINALKINSNHVNVKLFEYGKIFLGPVDTREERYVLSGVTNSQNFREAKGVVDYILDRLNINNIDFKTSRIVNNIWHPNKSAIAEYKNMILGSYGYINPKVNHNFGHDEEIFGFEFDVQALRKLTNNIIFKPISKFPSHFEDITLTPGQNYNLKQVIDSIYKTSNFIKSVKLIKLFNDKYTLRIEYHHANKTLTDKDIEKLRNKVVKSLRSKKVKIDS